MSNEVLDLLDILQSQLGNSREQCDEYGALLWDRIEAVKLSHIDAQLCAAQLEAAVMEVANGQRKPGKLPTEPMVRLIHFARTGSVRNATAKATPQGQRERMSFYEDAMRDRKNHGALALELAYLREQVEQRRVACADETVEIHVPRYISRAKSDKLVDAVCRAITKHDVEFTRVKLVCPEQVSKPGTVSLDTWRSRDAGKIMDAAAGVGACDQQVKAPSHADGASGQKK